jgi:hypothetical protein
MTSLAELTTLKDRGVFIDGRKFFSRPFLRSWQVLSVMALGIACLVLVASILIQEYKAMNFYLAETIAFAIGLQITTNFGGC